MRDTPPEYREPSVQYQLFVEEGHHVSLWGTAPFDMEEEIELESTEEIQQLHVHIYIYTYIAYVHVCICMCDCVA